MSRSQDSGRPVAARLSPSTTVRREQVSNDPLLDNIPPQPQFNFEPPNYPRPVSSVTDQLEMATETFLINCRRKPTTLKEATSTTDENRLQMLSDSNAWKSIVILSSKMLSDENSHIDGNFWRLRFVGLFRMKMYDDLITEGNNLLNNEERKDESSKNYDTIYSMKLLLLEMKVMTGRNQEALDQMYALRSRLQAIDAQQSDSRHNAHFWLMQITSQIINAAVKLRNWRTAVVELRSLLCIVRVDLAKLKDEDEKVLVPLRRSQVMLCLKLSSALLQIGAVKASNLYHDKASQLCAADARVSKDCNIDSHILLNQGVLLMCSNQAQQYVQALDLFSIVMDLERSNCAPGADGDALPLLSSSASTRVFSLYGLSDESLLASAVNNAAICALYVKQISRAISLLEALVVENPSLHMTDPVIFNLCTLYDLSFAPEVSTNKKKVLQKVAVRFGVEDPVLHWRSFRLT